VKGCFSHRPFLLDSFLLSNEAHDTRANDFHFLLTRHLPFLRQTALQHPANRKKIPKDQQKAPTLPSRPSANSPCFRISIASLDLDSVHSLVRLFFAAMKFFESQHEFDYSWEEVSTANWRKYCPWNDKSTHVIAVDTISRHVDPVTGIVSLLLHCFISTVSNVHTSSAPNASSPANNPHRNGSVPSSAAKMSRKSTRHPTSTLPPKRSPCAA
jgi:hypothetical protein